MSGGVDSTVAAYLLREQGYTVRGVHLLLWHGQDINPVAAAALERVRLAADQLGIPLEVLDWQQKFRASVIEPYVSDLKAGLTPNPCITCNRAIKWGALLDYVQRQGASWLASGLVVWLIGGTSVTVGASGLVRKDVAPNSPNEIVKAKTAPTSAGLTKIGRSTSHHTHSCDAPNTASAWRRLLVNTAELRPWGTSLCRRKASSKSAYSMM